MYDAQTLQSTLESGHGAGYDGHKKKMGSLAKHSFAGVHAAVDSLGYLLALTVTPANQQERSQVVELSRQVQAVTDNTVEVAWVDQGYTGYKSYTGDAAEQAAQAVGIRWEVIRLPDAKKGLVLLPGRWVVERSFSGCRCATGKNRFRRLARDYERLPQTLVGLHFVVFGCNPAHAAAWQHALECITPSI